MNRPHSVGHERGSQRSDSLATTLAPGSIQQELENILSSHVFAHSKRLSRFLRFIVEQAICGRGDNLKEYVLGIEVFDREPSFDPPTDPIVRVEAGRLRIKLKEYYRGPGRGDEVRIECVKGTYVPCFREHKPSVPRSSTQNAESSRRKEWSIAVLPFCDLSAAKDQESFCDGITEEVTSALARQPGIRVAARTSAHAFKGKLYSISEVGEKLNVGAILEGSVRKDGQRLRIATQLTGVADGFELWSEVHERAGEDPFLIQDEIARAVVENLRARLWNRKMRYPAQPPAEDAEAYGLYLKGRYYWNKRTEEDLHTAVQYFQEAIAENPAYALAYAGLADSYSVLGTCGALAPKEAMLKAKAAALKALQIDGDLAEACASLGFVNSVYDWDWMQAEQQFRAAIELNPRYATARQWYAVNCLCPMGRIDEAILQIKRAEKLDPASLVIGTVAGQLYCFNGQYGAAVDQLRKIVAMDPNFYFAHWHLGLAYAAQAKWKEAIASLKTASAAIGESSFLTGSLGQVYAWSGDGDSGRKMLSILREMSARRYVCPLEIAGIHAALGEEEDAYKWLEKALGERSTAMIHLHLHFAHRPMQTQTRFLAILRRVGLAPLP